MSEAGSNAAARGGSGGVALGRVVVPALLGVLTLVALPAALLATTLLSFRHAIPGPSGFYALRGALPWSDAVDYWSAAQHLMQTGVLDEWGSRRPINGAWVAARLGLAHDDLAWTMTIASIVLGITLGALVAVIGRRIGAWSAGLSACALVAVGATVQCTLQSEGLGLALGAAAVALLVDGAARLRRAALIPRAAKSGATSAGDADPSSSTSTVGLGTTALGLALLSVAMAVRPGALFTLPALAGWFIWTYRKRWGLAAAIAVAALAAGSAVDAGARSLYGSPSVAGNANFAGTVLGLARGTDYYEAMRAIRAEHPDAANEAELARVAYRASWRHIVDSPTTFAGSLARNEWKFLRRFWPVLMLAFIGWRRAPRGERSLWLWGWLGILASVPIVHGDGGIRVLASTWAFLIASGMSAFGRSRRGVDDVAALSTTASSAPRATATGAHARRDPPCFAAAIGAVASSIAITFALLGPWCERRLGCLDRIPRPGAFGADPIPRPGASEVDWIRARPALPMILVVERGQFSDPHSQGLDIPLEVPIVPRDELLRDPAVLEFGEPLDRVPAPFLLCVAYDVNQSRARVFTLPLSEATDRALTDGSRAPVLRVDSNALRPGGRVRVGIEVAPEH